MSSSQAGQKQKQPVKPKPGAIKKKPAFIRRIHLQLPDDDKEGPRPLTKVVLVLAGAAFLGGGSAVVMYGQRNVASDFILIGSFMIVFGCLFIGMAVLFVVRPCCKRRKVQAAPEEQRKPDASAQNNEKPTLGANLDDPTAHRRPSRMELYYGEVEGEPVKGGRSSPVKQKPTPPPPPILSLPNETDRELDPVIETTLVVESMEEQRDETNQRSNDK